MDASVLMFPRTALTFWLLIRLVEILGGGLVVLVGLWLFALSCCAMYWVTTAEHHLGTFIGHLLWTIGQELVAILLVLAWAVVFWGGLWVVEVPEEASLGHVVGWLAVPSVVVWLIAKICWIVKMWRLLRYLLLQVAWLFTLFIACRPYFVVATAIPAMPIGEYYGQLENPNTVMRRLAETAFALEGFRWHRWNINQADDSSTLLYEVTSAGSLMEWWHRRRMEQGGTRNLDADAYTQHVGLLRAFPDRWAAMYMVDTWWADDKEAGQRLSAMAQIRRQSRRVELLIVANNPEAAHEVMQEVVALHEDHDFPLDEDLHFKRAQVAIAAGETETAIIAVNEYVEVAGTAGEFYQEALALLDAAEVRAGEEAVERERATRWPPGETFRDCGVCPEMVVLNGSRLALGRYEVTVGEYRAFVSTTDGGTGVCAYGNSSWRDPGFAQTERHPVTCMSWEDAQEYASWLSRTTGAQYRLPTGVEWEQGSAGSRPGCNWGGGGRGTCPVGAYGANGQGVSDMVGNVLEWTEDCWDDNCDRRLLRGGSWMEGAERVGPGLRYRNDTTVGYVIYGFRVARILD